MAEEQGGSETHAVDFRSPVRIPCAHCGGLGTCKNGLEKASCLTCSSNRSRSSATVQPQVGMPCSVCNGRGALEGFSLKLQHRFPFYFAIGFTTVAIIIVALSSWSDKGEIASPLLTLIGTVIGFYFGGKAHG
jgi:hypothetical protein